MEMTFAPGWTQTIDTSSEVAERVDLATYISDTYKAVNGIRPRWYDFQGAEIKYLREWAAHLEEEVMEEISLERAREALRQQEMVDHHTAVAAAMKPASLTFKPFANLKELLI